MIDVKDMPVKRKKNTSTVLNILTVFIEKKSYMFIPSPLHSQCILNTQVIHDLLDNSIKTDNKQQSCESCVFNQHQIEIKVAVRPKLQINNIIIQTNTLRRKDLQKPKNVKLKEKENEHATVLKT